MTKETHFYAGQGNLQWLFSCLLIPIFKGHIYSSEGRIYGHSLNAEISPFTFLSYPCSRGEEPSSACRSLHLGWWWPTWNRWRENSLFLSSWLVCNRHFEFRSCKFSASDRLRSGLTLQKVLSGAGCTAPCWLSPPGRYLWKLKLWIPCSPKPPARQQCVWAQQTAGCLATELSPAMPSSPFSFRSYLSSTMLLPELLAVKCAGLSAAMPTSLCEYSPWALLACASLWNVRITSGSYPWDQLH